jgi:hypothetical protein
MVKSAFDHGMSDEQLQGIELAAKFCEETLPTGWTVRLEMRKPRSRYLLVSPDGALIDPSRVTWFPWKPDLHPFENLVRFAVLLHETDQ